MYQIRHVYAFTKTLYVTAGDVVALYRSVGVHYIVVLVCTIMTAGDVVALYHDVDAL